MMFMNQPRIMVMSHGGLISQRGASEDVFLSSLDFVFLCSLPQIQVKEIGGLIILTSVWLMINALIICDFITTVIKSVFNFFENLESIIVLISILRSQLRQLADTLEKLLLDIEESIKTTGGYPGRLEIRR
ncbi:hypothetical protein LXL04_009858 [Taraxacum kok-saghyz]